MGYQVQFEDGHVVEFDQKPTQQDIEDAYAHVKGASKPAKEQETSQKPLPDAASQIPGQTSTSVAQAPISARQHIEAGLEAGANTVAGLAGGTVLGPLALGTNVLNRAYRTAMGQGTDGLPTAEEAFNTGSSLLSNPLTEISSPLGKEYTEKAGNFLSDILPGMMHLHTVLPENAQLRARADTLGRTTIPKEVSVSPTSDKAAALQKLDEKPAQQTGPIVSPEIQAAQEMLNRQSQAEQYGGLKDRRTSSRVEPDHPTQDVLPFTNDISDRLATSAAEDGLHQPDLFTSPSEEFLNKQEDARRAADTDKMRNATQMEIDDTEHVPPDSNQVIAPQYGAMEGVGRVDENGMPIKADLTMEARNLENPLQRNLWGDELDQKHEQENPVSLTKAIDSMPSQPWHGDARDQALGRFQDPNPYGNDIVKFNSGTPFDIENIKKIVSDFGELTNFVRGLIETGHNTFMAASAKAKAMLGDAWNNVKDRFSTAWEHAKDSSKAINSIADTAGKLNEGLGEFVRKVSNVRYNRENAATDYLASTHDLVTNAGDKFQKPDTPEETIAKVLSPGVKDMPDPITKFGIGPFKINAPTLGNTLHSLQQSLKMGLNMEAAKHAENPLLHAISRTLNYAATKTQYQVRTLVAPLERMISSLSTQSLLDLHGALKQEMFREKPYTVEQLREAGYTPEQIKVHQMLRQAYDTAYSVQDAARKMLGMDSISKLDHYYASVWHGDWHMPIVDGNGKLAWYIRTTTKAEGLKALNYLKTNHPELKIPEDTAPKFMGGNKNPMIPQDVSGAYHDMLGFFKDDPVMSKAVQEGLAQYIADKGYGTVGQSKHFLEKNNVRGFEGDRPWNTPRENAFDGMKAQMSYLKNAMRWSNYQEAIANAKEVLSHPEVNAKLPNTTLYGNSVLEHESGATNALTSQFENSLAKWTGRSRGNLYSIAGDLKTGMYVQQLGLNTAYMIATPMQYAITGPAWHAVLSSVEGHKTGIIGGIKTIGLSLTDSAAGVLSHMAHELGMKDMQVPMSDIGKRALQYAEDSGIVSRNLFDEGGDMGEHRAFGALKSGLGWTIGFPEKVARMNAFMGFVHHLDASGHFKGNEAGMFRLAQEYTNRAMTSFESHDRPQAVANLGTLGQLGYVYKSYVFNQAHTMLAMGKLASKGNIAPLGLLLGSYALIGGVQNMPVVNELDGLLQGFKTVAANFFPEQYVKHQMANWDLKRTLIEALPVSAAYRSTLQQGLVSKATGADIGTHLSGQILDTQHPMNNIPGAVPAQEAKEMLAVAGGIHHWNMDGVYSGVHQALAPPLVKGLMESNIPAFRQGNNPQAQVMYKPADLNAAQTMEHRRTEDDTWYRNRGLTSYNEGQDKRNIYRANETEQNNDAATKTLMEHMKHGIKTFNPNGGNDDLVNAARSYEFLNPGSNMRQVLNKAALDVNTTPLEQKEMAIRSARAAEYYMRYKGQPK